MKALKTIVATAVIVFTLTTVAMAGVQHLSRRGDEATSAGPATQAAAQPAAQGGVTLSTRQFAALLRAVNGGTHDPGTTRTHAATKGHAHQPSHSHTATGNAGSGASSGATHHTAVHHTETHHTAAHTTSHNGCAHDGTHDGGTHGGSGDGGCD